MWSPSWSLSWTFKVCDFHFNLRSVLTLFKTMTIIHSQLTVEYIFYNKQASKRRRKRGEGKKEGREEEGKKETFKTLLIATLCY